MEKSDFKLTFTQKFFILYCTGNRFDLAQVTASNKEVFGKNCICLFSRIFCPVSVLKLVIY